MEKRIEYALEQRRQKGTLRTLPMSSSLVSPSGSSSSTSSLEPLHVSPTIMNSPDSSCIDNTMTTKTKIDFSSNDYLGLACDKEQIDLVNRTYNDYITKQQGTSTNNILGSTGSRLLSGDTLYIHTLEKQLAFVHSMKTSIIYNSGYVANIGIISCLPCNIILYDEYCHNSIVMGIRLWKSYTNEKNQTQSSSDSNNENVGISFEHNNIHDLEIKLQQQRKQQNNNIDTESNSNIICIIIESVYSMDGDIANILRILQLAIQYNAYVIVDEAHSIGLYDTLSGTGLTTSSINNYTFTYSTNTNDNNTTTSTIYQNEQEQFNKYKQLMFDRIVCIIYPLGKGPGCHGAVVCTNNIVYKEYLINYSYPFIYSTSLPIHTLLTIQCSYQTFTSSNTLSSTSISNSSSSSSSRNSNIGQQLRTKLYNNIYYFQKQLKHQLHLYYTSIKDSNDGNSNSNSSSNNGNTSTTSSSSIVYCWLREQSSSSSSSSSSSPLPVQVAQGHEQKQQDSHEQNNDNVIIVSPIQALMISGGNEICTKFCTILFSLSLTTIKLYPIKFPTIPIGQERIRIIIHSTNTIQQINYLINLILQTLHILNSTTSNTTTIVTNNNKLVLSKL